LLVREGQINRAQALERLEKENQLYWDEIEQLLDYAGVKESLGAGLSSRLSQ
jgi:hypothetical protein